MCSSESKATSPKPRLQSPSCGCHCWEQARCTLALSAASGALFTLAALCFPNVQWLEVLHSPTWHRTAFGSSCCQRMWVPLPSCHGEPRERAGMLSGCVFLVVLLSLCFSSQCCLASIHVLLGCTQLSCAFTLCTARCSSRCLQHFFFMLLSGVSWLASQEGLLLLPFLLHPALVMEGVSGRRVGRAVFFCSLWASEWAPASFACLPGPWLHSQLSPPAAVLSFFLLEVAAGCLPLASSAQHTENHVGRPGGPEVSPLAGALLESCVI